VVEAPLASPVEPAHPLLEPGTGLEPRLTVIAPVHPLTVGAAQFNTAMVRALRQRTQADLISWRRMYPPLLYRGVTSDSTSRPPQYESAAFMLDWHDPRSWRRACRRIEAYAPSAVVLPWVHPVMVPPYRWLLRHTPAHVLRVVICHNVETHERVVLHRALTRSVLRHADLLVTHAAHQRGELAALGLESIPIAPLFHPHFDAQELARPTPAGAAEAVRARLGDPDVLLLAYGAVRPYKGVELAVEALARLDRSLRVGLVIAGRFWGGRGAIESLAQRVGVEARVELRDRYVTNEETAALFAACDAAILPYRSASQSGVVGLAFAHRRPVIATRVGGLPESVRDGVDGVLCEPDDPAALAAAIERFIARRRELNRGAGSNHAARSFARYAELLLAAVKDTRKAPA
jgi:glycosyltransferase involved in cell wall biosynthesis